MSKRLPSFSTTILWLFLAVRTGSWIYMTVRYL